MLYEEDMNIQSLWMGEFLIQIMDEKWSLG
jgi:hypothetical protein